MRLRFGACRLDLEQRLLLRDGKAQALAPKAFDLLRLLVSSRPRVLTKGEIMDVVWPDLYVAEANVAVLIGEIRAAIGDSASHPSLIKTYHRVGYAFVGDVVELPPTVLVPTGGPRYRLAFEERRIELPYGTFVVGRDAACDIVLTDPSVSRRHARLMLSAESIALEDLGSKNGTKLDGQRLTTAATVAARARLEFGAVAATVEVDRPHDASTLTL